MDQRVAVIIPAYNGSVLLPETLDSILGQTLPPAEIMVVDDGSPESLDECIKAYEPKGVRFLRTPNRGVNAARNTGAESTSSPWVAFCDQDDLWLPQKLERQMELLARAPDCQYCICDLRNFSTDGLAEESHFDFAPPGYWDEGRRDFGAAGFVIERNMFADFLTFQPAITATPLMGREFFKKVGGWNVENSKNSAQDFEFHLLCSNHPPIGVVPEVLMHYRRHAGNWSSDELLQDYSGVQILEYMLPRYEVARQHEQRIRKEIQQRTLACADRAFFEGRMSLFREYLGKVPLRRRPARLVARDLLGRALPEQTYDAIRRSVRTLRSKLSA
jgi:glycosyltransferase involved in cell wall biosynthesis